MQRESIDDLFVIKPSILPESNDATIPEYIQAFN
jgi:hypothetical protein